MSDTDRSDSTTTPPLGATGIDTLRTYEFRLEMMGTIKGPDELHATKVYQMAYAAFEAVISVNNGGKPDAAFVSPHTAYFSEYAPPRRFSDGSMVYHKDVSPDNARKMQFKASSQERYRPNVGKILSATYDPKDNVWKYQVQFPRPDAVGRDMVFTLEETVLRDFGDLLR